MTRLQNQTGGPAAEPGAGNGNLQPKPIQLNFMPPWKGMAVMAVIGLLAGAAGAAVMTLVFPPPAPAGLASKADLEALKQDLVSELAKAQAGKKAEGESGQDSQDKDKLPANVDKGIQAAVAPLNKRIGVLEGNLNQKVDERVNSNIDQKVNAAIDQRLDGKVDQRIDQKFEAKVDQRISKKVEELRSHGGGAGTGGKSSPPPASSPAGRGGKVDNPPAADDKVALPEPKQGP